MVLVSFESEKMHGLMSEGEGYVHGHDGYHHDRTCDVVTGSDFGVESANGYDGDEEYCDDY